MYAGTAYKQLISMNRRSDHRKKTTEQRFSSYVDNRCSVFLNNSYLLQQRL